VSFIEFMEKMDTDEISVEAVVSGLSCAEHLMRTGIESLTLEGGRKTGRR